MINSHVDIAVIGGGPAGLVAAIEAKREGGCKDVIVLERNQWLGGILPQCIHDGFGVEETGISLTGPEYADYYIQLAEDEGIQLYKDTMVFNLNRTREIYAVNKRGLHKIKAKAIILATGCREKTRWNAMIPGDRPSGIYTAGVAQALINLYNIMPGKKVMILGSGDVGLIMARRLTLEGANVLGVAEILPYANGLPRNIVQCLEDYNIPLLTSHTVAHIKGRGRLEQVTLTQVDDSLSPVRGTEKKMKCDTLLLSLGLIPENELAQSVGILIDDATGGPVINQYFETNILGIYSIGNSLQVYDTVDMLCSASKKAGRCAGKSIFVRTPHEIGKILIHVTPGPGVIHVTPHRITCLGIISFTVRACKPISPAVLRIISGKRTILEKKLRFVNPANLIQIEVEVPEKQGLYPQQWKVIIDG